MGLELAKSDFTQEDFDQFSSLLHRETLQLLEWLKSDQFSHRGYSAGIELEGWLIDPYGRPVAANQEFLRRMAHPQIQCELSQYNVEINSRPVELSRFGLSQLQSELTDLTGKCRQLATSLGQEFVAIGTPPTLQREMMGLESMTPSKRYRALNDSVFPAHQTSGHLLHMTGREELKLQLGDVMMASAATSLQFHLKAPADRILYLLNAAQIVAAPMVALSANAPFLLGKDLWMESRIPLFEHVLNGARSKRDKSQVSRVSFGRAYVQESLAEYFLDNLHNFPILLPDRSDRDIQEMAHLSLHNGTIWRWNRLVVGFEESGQPHLRIEHRPPSSSPTPMDAVADLAFFVGLTVAVSHQVRDFEKDFPFQLMRRNFYRAAKFGLDTEVYWAHGHRVNLRDLLLRELIPQAKSGLLTIGVPAEEIQTYIDHIILPRVLSGQTGAQWQRDFIAQNGPDSFDKLILTYLARQKSALPVHLWEGL
ncbi:MAG: hypothetical protein H6624_16430 [Bdellovibrionaceae bacterium]|nr:hypothetical protein [Bdellovibrionales bacterium]MCB9085934.1 hypothetical protein [Pseudobdellovibrionaceae bacterium]